MKILILTQPLGQNVGGLLQAYALQKYLIDAGHEVVTLDRRWSESFFERVDEFIYNKRYMSGNGKRFLKLMNKIKDKIKRSPNHDPKISTRDESHFQNLVSFRDEFIVLSPRVNTSRQLRSYFEKELFDVVIVGSDQVWRPKYSPGLANFFLDFLRNHNRPTKKLSYAASFGVETWEYTPEETEKCRALIGEFNAVTVREKSAVVQCKNYFNVMAEVVSDPTLLLEQQDYRKLFSDNDRNKYNQDLVTSYILDSNNDKREIVKNIARHVGNSIVSIEPYQFGKGADDEKIMHLSVPTISEWLRAFASSRFIVTDSFHGCVFSIIFNKPFVALGNKDRGLCRFESLLELFKLDNRLILSKNDLDYNSLIKDLDWESVNKCKKDLVAVSHEFLRMNLIDELSKV